ncbi:aminoglycoside phosphotransferase family protein [Glycomyces sp. TRM65418]|uniref:aminoglycoside phosphotransferase family protein n=1 Tax=Glycomyces sp. TRM65418 TaxID=2867006 RepID=UPI001CE561CE|nr:aminoglycoside phosphotransferase family protein [Glycomyces sp. TRM65418]MCC3763100.1 aminoglycoside phosphotransferase family protein [Glycomyces sp. TRM65418]QZD57108.1 aminoglycoside phosphotransferase family protein [Glycomyces sp. TRM65418]
MRFGVVPSSVRRDVTAWHGTAGQAWLDGLPQTVWRLTRLWSLRIDGPPYGGGSHSYVVPVRREDGSPAVLKVIYRDEENRAEPTALHRYAGDGAVQLYEYDPQTGAMLLERAVPGNRLRSTRFFGHKTPQAAWRRIGIACGLYRRLWRSADVPDGYPELPAATEMLDHWRRDYADPYGEARRGPGANRLDLALDLCERLADPPELGIGNRDTHLDNIVSAERESWLVIDPKPYLAERAFDGGYFLFKQQHHGPHGGADLLHAVAEGLGADAERVRAWALLRAIEHLTDTEDERDRQAAEATVSALELA